MTNDERNMLIDAIEAAELESPEQVADNVLACETYAAGRAKLDAAIESQPMYAVEVRAIGGWTTHSRHVGLAAARDQAEYLPGSRVVRA